MKKLGDVLRGVVGVLLLAGLAIVLSLALQGPAGEEPASPSMAQEEVVDTVVAQSSVETPAPTPTAPSEDWPTLTPEPTPPPPPTTSGEPKPTVQVTPVQPFPTPAFPPTPDGDRPVDLQTIWYPYFPAPDSQPQFQAVLVDAEGQRWGRSDRLVDLTLPSRQPGPDPGPILADLHASPNYHWMIADFAYVGSRLVDLSSGMSSPLTDDSTAAPWYFLAWQPEGQHILAATAEGFSLIDLVSQKYESVDFQSESGNTLPVRALAYSPDGKQLADILVYAPNVSKSDFEIEVGVRADERDPRTPLLRIPGGDMIAEHSLRWSPDGRKLIFVADIHKDGRCTQLWVVNVADGTSQVLMQLAKDLQYNHPAVWSPDGRYIAAIKIEPGNGGGVFLIEAETGQERRIAHFTDRQLSHLRWSPDGQKLAFTLSTKDYGEIWMTNLDGTLQYPIAGPAVPDAPFVWLPAVEGEG
jgi:hypothetical protein